MGFRDAIEQIGAGRSLKVRTLPPTSQMAVAASALAERMARFAEPSVFDLDALQTKLIQVASTGNWIPVSEKELRYACFCLWRTTPPLANDVRFVEGYFGALRSISSRIATKGLIRSYLMHFDLRAPGLAGVGQYLRGVVGNWDWQWASLEREYRLFSPDEAPRRLATGAIESGNPRLFLEKIGLKGQLGVGPLAAACFRVVADTLGGLISKEPKVATAQILTDWAAHTDGRLTYNTERRSLADALLLPWIDSDPPDELRTHLTNFFLATYKDPRISPLAWNEVDESSKNVILRWLAKGSLEQFLRVVDKTAPGHQWDYRRAFWSAFIDRHYVRDAWVAFGSSGQEYALRLAETTEDKNMSRFGHLERAYDGTQAVLLLRIGDLIVADWSHNGTLRIWRRGNAEAPAFYRHQYAAPDLRKGSDFSRIHSHPPGAWQSDTAAFIRRHTRIALESRDYMPKARRR